MRYLAVQITWLTIIAMSRPAIRREPAQQPGRSSLQCLQPARGRTAAGHGSYNGVVMPPTKQPAGSQGSAGTPGQDAARAERDVPPGEPGRTAALRAALSERVVIADGAMGSMLQGSAAALDDFAGHEARADRSDAIGGIPARPGALDRRRHHASSGGQVLQHLIPVCRGR
jgi:hypothetical protein